MSWISAWYKGPSEKVDIIFDIGSSTVGCAVFGVKENGKTHIYYSTRVSLVFQSHLQYDRFVKEMLRGLIEVSEEVSRFLASPSNNLKVKTVSCSLSSIWYVSKTHFLSFNKKEAFLVSPRFVEKMLERIEDHAKKEKSSLWQNKHLEDPALIDKKLLSVDLNGYRTTKPFGKRATRIDLSLHLAFMSKIIRKYISEVLDSHFRTNITFYSRVLSTYTVVRDCYAKTDRFLIIDVSGEVSDVTLVLQDVIQETVSFPIGVRTLMRLMAKKRNSTPQEALSLMRMVTEKNIDLNKDSNEFKLVQEIGNEWGDMLNKALGRFTSTSPLPQQIFMTAPQDTSRWFKQLLELHFNSGDENGNDHYTVTLLTPDLMRHFFSFDQKVVPDSSLLLQSIHLSRLRSHL